MTCGRQDTMIFDTDIFIWAQRGNEKAVRLFEKEEEKYLSIQTYMELLQCAKNKIQHKQTKDFLTSFGFIVLPLTENIGHRASIYVEEYKTGTASDIYGGFQVNLPKGNYTFNL